MKVRIISTLFSATSLRPSKKMPDSMKVFNKCLLNERRIIYMGSRGNRISNISPNMLQHHGLFKF